MTFNETALINKGKVEMELWANVYSHFINKGYDSLRAKDNAETAIKDFNEEFDDYGNII